jgi:long-chain alkane monooxygenase
MSRHLLLNAFHMNTVGHQSPGLWTHPRDRSRHYTDLSQWTDLARTLERGLFDGLFLADVLGVYDVYAGSRNAALKHAVQIPVNDPSLLIPAMAHVTEHLGFGVTCTLSYEPPYPFARRMSTLDHLTKGRIGWNIVTGYLDSAAKGMGKKNQDSHDRRYDVAEDYMQVVYKLWEGSWADDAVKADKASRIFADPARVRAVQHQGEFYQLDAIHLSEPSPQRTPVLYQAGASGRGRGFAAAHAEAVFINGPSAAVVAPYVADIRKRAVEAGRSGEDIRILSMATVIPGRDDKEAESKHAEYRRYVDHEAALALLSGWTGIDLSKYGLDDVLRAEKTEASQSVVAAFTTADPSVQWTMRKLAEKAAIGGRGPVFVGGPKTIVDQMLAFADQTGVDGFNLAYAVFPESFTDFIDLVVPELQKRGRYKIAYAKGTLREKLFPQRGPRLSATHPAAGYRFV